MAADSYDKKYTRPNLRRRLKAELKHSDKGGHAGQWSARKSQMLVQEYEKQGGDYKNHESQQAAADSLKEWTAQDWQTADGSADARVGDMTKRYLPAQAWDLLSDAEKQQAEQKKERGSQAGEQFVANTVAAKAARAFVDHGDAHELRESQLNRLTKRELDAIARSENLPNRSKMNKAQLARTLRKHFRRDGKPEKSGKA